MLHSTMNPPRSKDGSLHVTDEVWNTIISSLGALLSLVGVILMVKHAKAVAPASHVWALAIYGFGLINMFLSSALHHGIHGSPKTNHYLWLYDYFSISLMIAGTFTPFCVIVVKNALGWTVLGLIWTLALLGIALKGFFPHVPRWIMTSLFIGMGWTSLLIVKPLYQAMHWQGFSLLLLGGLFYTVGGLIYVFEKPNLFPGKFGFHEVWHCFVVAGAGSHFYLIYSYL